jgi:hypothetical protein
VRSNEKPQWEWQARERPNSTPVSYGESYQFYFGIDWLWNKIYRAIIILFAVSRAPAYLAHFAQSRATSAYPFRPGIKISEMTKSIFDFSSVDRASSPSAAWRTSYPAFVRTRDKFPVTFFHRLRCRRGTPDSRFALANSDSSEELPLTLGPGE